MRPKWHVTAALVLALTGLLGLGYFAWAESGTNTAAVREYEGRLQKVDHNKIDDLYALAKWCLTNDLRGEAKALALEILEKSPDDLRAKYLLYAIATGGFIGPIKPLGAIEREGRFSGEEADALFALEGEKQMRDFREVQRTLATGCGAAKCHGGSNDQSKWSLILKNPTAKTTLAENFQTLNRYINRDNVTDSPILQKPMKGKEGGHPGIEMRLNDPTYLKLVTWMKTLKTKTGIIWDEAGKAALPPPAPK
jgi:hypothetical protein